MSVSENQCNLMALADQYFVLQNFFDNIHKRGESNENRVYRFGDDRGDPFTEDRRKRGGETERRLFLRRQGGQDFLVGSFLRCFTNTQYRRNIITYCRLHFAANVFTALSKDMPTLAVTKVADRKSVV